MRDALEEIATEITALLRGAESFTCTFSAEDSDFVRFNRGAIRQAGSVEQCRIGVDLIEGRRHASGSLTLSGDAELDAPRVRELIERLRERRRGVPEDPYLLYSTTPEESDRSDGNRLPEAAECVESVRALGRGRDLVGVLALGGTHAGFASSLGHRHWQTRHSFHLDWSYHREDGRAVKEGYAGFAWDAGALAERGERAGERLRALDRAPKSLSPGRYRVYLAPAALDEIFSILCWGGFGLRAHRTRSTPLVRMVTEGLRLHPSIQLGENTAEGLAPPFNDAGFLRPSRVPLIREGAYEECLVSPRSALEFAAETNGASAAESPLSLDLAAGQLATDEVLAALGDGIYVSNLWYLNYSDRSACRTTGMTRFATFWVEGGRLVAPVDAMRFDETLYRMLGDNLVALTRERETLFDPGTYGSRSLRSARLPGALIDDFTLTL